MACDWKEVRQLAASLKSTSIQNGALVEPVARSAVSRYYYSTYHRALAWASLNEMPSLDLTQSVHKQLWNWMFTKTGLPWFAARGYTQGHGARRVADYDLSCKELQFTQGYFDHEWTNLERVHQLLKALPSQWPMDPILIQPELKRLTDEAKLLWPAT